MLTFRCDDVSINTDQIKLGKMLNLLTSKFKCRVICGISPLVHDMSNTSGLEKERIFPKILNAYSDYRCFYRVEKAGIPKIDNTNVEMAGHGLIHVDHRLLSKEVQEISIIVSSNLVDAKIFIPPFNKWDKNTEDICKEQKIELIKFEDGWKHLSYNKVNDINGLYYFHTHDFTFEEFEKVIS